MSNSLEWSSRMNSPVCSEVSHTRTRGELGFCLFGDDEKVWGDSFRWAWSGKMTTCCCGLLGMCTTCRCGSSEMSTTCRCGGLLGVKTTCRCGEWSVATTTWRLELLEIACCAALSLLSNCRDCLLFLCFGIKNTNLESCSITLSLYLPKQVKDVANIVGYKMVDWDTRSYLNPGYGTNVVNCEHRITSTSKDSQTLVLIRGELEITTLNLNLRCAFWAKMWNENTTRDAAWTRSS